MTLLLNRHTVFSGQATTRLLEALNSQPSERHLPKNLIHLSTADEEDAQASNLGPGQNERPQDEAGLRTPAQGVTGARIGAWPPTKENPTAGAPLRRESNRSGETG